MASDHTHGQPVTFTDDHAEMEMERGNAYQRTSGRVVFVDARCVGCRTVAVNTLPPRDESEWIRGNSFADFCRHCTALTPHNVLALLDGLNRDRDRGHLQTDD